MPRALTPDPRPLLIRELRTAARGIDHSLADEPDYERFDAAVAAIEAHALAATPAPLDDTDRMNLSEVVDSQVALGHKMTLVPTDVLVRLLASTPAPLDARHAALVAAALGYFGQHEIDAPCDCGTCAAVRTVFPDMTDHQIAALFFHPDALRAALASEEADRGS